MTNIVPFTATGALPSTIVNRRRKIDVNKDIVTTAPFPTLSIKGKVFKLVQDNERKILTKPDDPDEVLQAVNVVALRINMTTKNYYSKRYTEEESEGVRPDCYSLDGITPAENAPNRQAEKCALCPRNQWGSRISDDGTSKGKACSDNARMAIADPNHLDKPMLLRVPPASLRPLKDALKMVKQRGIQYNEVIFRVGFDPEAPSPKLTFKPVGVLDDAAYDTACEQFETEMVRAIVGVDDNGQAALPAPAPDPVEGDELDAALAARDATRKAAGTAKVSEDELAAVVTAPAPAPAKAAKPAAAKPAAAKPAKPAAAPAPAPASVAPIVGDGEALLSELSDLLGSSDD